MMDDLMTPYNNKLGLHDIVSGGATSETNSAQSVIADGQTIPDGGGSAYFCFPLIDGLVGTLAEKAICLGALMAGDLRLECT
jgi:hypothetical protein